MISPADHSILQIEGNVACHRRCANCVRMVAHAPVQWEMDPPTFRKALNSVKDWWRPGRVIGLIGGEITSSSFFPDICKIFRDEFNPGVLTNGRAPIADFNAFAIERLFDRSNGKGLWTSFGPKFRDNYELIFETFSHLNPNAHDAEGPSLHQAMLISREEYCKTTGMSDEQWVKNRDSCAFQRMWSASITPHGGFFCEMAGVLDSIYFGGKHAWKIEPGWWRRKPSEFGDQLELCNLCSLAQPGPSRMDFEERDIISRDHVKMLEALGSPAVKKGKYDVYDASVHTEKREVQTIDNYANPNGVRVSNTNPNVLPKSVSAVVVCVGRSQHLAVTLPGLMMMVNEVRVVTHPDDIATQQVCHEHALVPVLSSRCYEQKAAFNKGALINDGLATLDSPDWVLLIDADVQINPKFREFFFSHSFNPGCLYFTSRTGSDSPGNINSEPNGYFTLFNPKAQAIRDRWPTRHYGDAVTRRPLCENFVSAGGIDSWFMQQWPRDKLIHVPELAVEHIEHGSFASGWNGTITTPAWRQIGMLTASGYIPLDGKEPHGKLKLTDTLYGETVEVEFDGGSLPKDVLSMDGHDMVFMGKKLNGCHVHVARYGE